MKNALYTLIARILGRNIASTPASVIAAQLVERRPLPIGRQEFEDWSDRIISGALVTADIDSQKFALADMLLHLGPTESHKEDAHFIHCLKKSAINQVAVAVRQELHEKAKARLAEEAAKAEELKKVEQDAAATLDRAKTLSLVDQKAV